jgi:hypothetical protein
MQIDMYMRWPTRTERSGEISSATSRDRVADLPHALPALSSPAAAAAAAAAAFSFAEPAASAAMGAA